MGISLRTTPGPFQNMPTSLYLYVGGNPEAKNNQFELEHTIEYGFNVYRIYYNSRGLNHLPGRLIKFIRYLRACWYGWKLIKKRHGLPAVCHIHILTRTSFLAYWLHLKHSIPYIISEHSGFFLNKNPGWYQQLKLFRKFVCRRAFAITVVSLRLMEGMKKFGLHGNYVIIPNTVFFGMSNGRIENHSPFKITTIGCNAEQYKNVLGIIQSYAEINEQLPDSILQIIGYGSAKKMLERAAAETGLLDKRIFFLGKIRNENVYSLLSESAFVVVNSRSESFSMAAAESIACGTPVLSTRCGGPEEFIDESNGHLIEAGNNQQLTQAIAWMSSHFSEFNREEIRKHAHSRFSEESIGKKFYELYLSALSSQADKSR